MVRIDVPHRPEPAAAPPDGQPPRRLRFDLPVDRRLVHKTAVEQVMLHDAERVGERSFVCAAQLARAHAYYSDLSSRVYDPLLLLEVCRQGVVLGSHEYFGVPHGWQFIFSDIRGTLEDPGALAVGPEPAECLVHLSLEDERYRRGTLSSGRFSARVVLDHRVVATLVGTATFFSRERYAALRQAMRRSVREEVPAEPPAPLPPSAVGRRDPRNVVIGDPVTEGDSYVTRLIVDETHTTFFDHPLDHVPAALLIEALRQGATAAASARLGLDPATAVLIHYEAEYSRLGELGAPVICEATPRAASEPPSGRVTVDLALRQFGSAIACARFELAPTRRPRRRPA